MHVYYDTYVCVSYVCTTSLHTNTDDLHTTARTSGDGDTRTPTHTHTHTQWPIYFVMCLFIYLNHLLIWLCREICDYVLFIAEIAQKKRQKSTENAQNKIFSVETVRFSTKSERLRQRNVHHHVKKKKS